MRTFLVCLLVLAVVNTFFYCYRIQKSTLVVTACLYLSVTRESSIRPGFGGILEKNTNVSLTRWPQTISENINVKPEYAFNETRTTPVQFVVSFYLDQTNKTFLTPNLTTTGSYSAVVTSTFPDLDQGTYDLIIKVHVLGFEKEQSELQRLVTIP